MVCAIQCAIAPIVLSFASLVPTWAHFGHGWIWISFILLIASWSIGRGYYKHKNNVVLYFATIGISLLFVGTLLEEKLTILFESAIFFTGGILLTIAHWKNFKLGGACATQQPQDKQRKG